MTTYEITQTLVDNDDEGTIIIVEGTDANFISRSVEFFIEHRDKKIQDKGQDALSIIVGAGGLREIDDSSDLLGKLIEESVFDRVEAIVNVRPKSKVKIETIAKPSVAVHKPTDDGRYVYVISCLDSPSPLCKVGIAGSAEKRLKTLSTASPHALRLELARYTANARSVEALSHVKFAHLRRNGEWFEMPAAEAIEFVNHTIAEGQA